MIHVTCRLTAKNRDQLSVIEYGLPLPFLLTYLDKQSLKQVSNEDHSAILCAACDCCL